MNKIFTVILLLFLSTTAFGQESNQIIVDTFYNKYRIEDKYRWLENIHSNEVKAWTENQEKLFKSQMSKVANKTNSFKGIDQYAYTEFNAPQKKGNYYFHMGRYNNFGVAALFYQKTLKDRPEILVDPNYISLKDKITLNSYSVSKDSKLLAYQFSRNGSDWREIKVVSIQDAVDLKDHLKGVKFSSIAWLKDGFFYSTFLQNEQFGKTTGERIFYHKIGTEQEQDKLIFEKKTDINSFFEYSTSSDEQYFILKSRSELTGKSTLLYIDYMSNDSGLKPLLTNLKYNIHILDSHNGKFIATTTKNSKNGSIIEIDPANPTNWREIAPEFSEALLLKAIPFSDRLVTVYQSNQHPIITILDYSGTVLYTLQMPVATSVDGFSENPTDEDLLFYFKSYTIPPVLYKFNIKTFKKELAEQTTVSFDFKTIGYKEVEYLTKDSVRVPMILVYNKELKQNGSNPTILQAYGGFGIVNQPSFDPGIVYFIKQGGIYAFANIRGGGDKGIDWARKGRGIYKQNSFDDFIAAAEFLIKNNYTSAEKLAATGTSNGGLVVATAAIQRPDLFRAVVPVVAPLDMIRFEKFTVGHWHTDEYGTVSDSVGFKRLLSYSPYHNIKNGVNYPSMLVITSENDDRVPPFHSYKFVAKLQNRDVQTNPVILKVEKASGHYGASTFMSNMKEKADIYGFIMYELMSK